MKEATSPPTHCGQTTDDAITPWSRVLPEKLKCPKLLRNFVHFIDPAGSSTFSQEPATSIQSMYPIQPLEDPF
jgi:hypothetical protein